MVEQKIGVQKKTIESHLGNLQRKADEKVLCSANRSVGG